MSVSEMVREAKRASSLWVKDRDNRLGDFYWQEGYGAFSISPFQVDLVREYIVNQEERQKSESFQDEFRRICEKYGVDIDERYVWD